MEFEVSYRSDAAQSRTEERPFNILVLGNFGGHTKSGSFSKGEQPAIRRVDIDDFDCLWDQFVPRLELGLQETEVSFAPADLDDFHPDQLCHKLPVFQELRDTRRKLLRSESAQTTLAELLSSRDHVEGELLDRLEEDEAIAGEDDRDLFERLLGKAPEQSKSPSRPAGRKRLDSFIERVVAPHIHHERDPRIDTAVDTLDAATAELMRELLHHPEFQALEASWRSLFELVSQLELDETLRLHVCNINHEELLRSLPEAGRLLEESGLFRLLVEQRRQAADDSPWTVIVGDYYFGPDPADVAVLTALGATAAAQGAVFLGGARPALLGCASIADLSDARYWSTGDETLSLWSTLRQNPIAAHIGLALPRVLSRLPYGKGTEEIDAFEFEEMPQRTHEQYLWANPAYSCCKILGENFSREGWRMSPSSHVGLGDLPAHHFSEDGESKLQPCAELLLSESTMVAILEQGLMPLVSYRNRNTAVIGRFQSIADPLKSLAGAWGG